MGLGVVLVATFMGQVDMFVVNVATPTIQTDLRTGFDTAQFVIDGYVMAYAAGLVTFGRLGDRWGRRRVFRCGVAAFAVASLLCALSPGGAQLVAARVAQGAAAAATMPQVLALVRATFTDERDRRRAVGLYGVVIGLGVVAGLAGGGLLLHLDVAGLGWRAVFLLNVPIGFGVFAAAGRTVPESRAVTAARPDVLGAVLTAALLPAALVPLSAGPQHGWPVWTTGCLPAAAVLAVWLAVHERRLAVRGGDPLWPARLLVVPGLRPRLAVVAAFFAGNAGLFLVFTYHLQSGLHRGPLATGLAFVPLGVGFAAASGASTRLADRHGATVAVAGALVMAVSLAALPVAVHIGPGRAPVALAVLIGGSGVGQGLVVSPLLAGVLTRVPPALAGAGAGVLNTVTQTAMAVGVAGVGALYRAVLGGDPRGPATPLSHDRFAAALTATSAVLVALALLVAAGAWRLRRDATPPAVTRDTGAAMRSSG